MRSPARCQPFERDLRALSAQLACYRVLDRGRSLFELAVTAFPFALLWVAMALILGAGYWIGLLLAVPTGVLLLRLFLIQHDCGHGAFFRHRYENDWLGRILGVLTFTPYEYWRRSHAIHHASTGNLDARGIGDVDTLTVREFDAMSWPGRLRYRLYRNPLVLFGLGPAYLFLLRHRLPIGMMRRGWKPWISVMGTNASIAAGAFAMIWLVGLKLFLIVHVPIVLIAASLGVWLFYVQHQFERTAWDHAADWTFPHAALHGSSYYALPGTLQWLTASVGIHHVHHLASRIPFYRLHEVLRDMPFLASTSRVGLLESFTGFRLALWDERTQRLVSFAKVSEQASGAA